MEDKFLNIFQLEHVLQTDAKRLTHFMANHQSWVEPSDVKPLIKEKEREISEALKPGDGRPGVMFNWPDNSGESNSKNVKPLQGMAPGFDSRQ